MVIVIIAILAALLLPVLQRAGGKGRAVQCANNLKQMGVAFHAFAHEHDDKFPMQVSTNAGGTLEFVRAGNRLGSNFFFAFRHFQALSNELGETKILVCPTDARAPAAGFATLKNENVSYFVAPNAELGRADGFLAGDGNLSRPSGAAGAILRLGANDAARWASNLHAQQGNILFADGHVERLNDASLHSALSRSSPATVLLPPVTPPAPVSTLASGSGSSSGESGTGESKTSGSSAGGTSGTSGAPGGSGGAGRAAGNATSETMATARGTPSLPVAEKSRPAAVIPPDSTTPKPLPPSALATAVPPPGESRFPRTGSSGSLATNSLTQTVPPAVRSDPPTTSNTISSPASSASLARRGQPPLLPRPPVADGTTEETASAESTSPTGNVSSVTPPDAEPSPSEPENWIALVAGYIGKLGAKTTYFILFLILATLIALEVARRRHATKDQLRGEDE